MNVYDYFLNRSNVLQRVNQHIVAQSTIHNLCGKGTASSGSCMQRERVRNSELCYLLAIFSFSVSSDVSSASPEDIAATVANSLHYVTSKEGKWGIPLSYVSLTFFCVY